MPRGGRREGAGRPIRGGGVEKRRSITLTLPPAQIDALEVAADFLEMSKSEVVEWVLSTTDLTKLKKPSGETGA